MSTGPSSRKDIATGDKDRPRGHREERGHSEKRRYLLRRLLGTGPVFPSLQFLPTPASPEPSQFPWPGKALPRPPVAGTLSQCCPPTCEVLLSRCLVLWLVITVVVLLLSILFL